IEIGGVHCGSGDKLNVQRRRDRRIERAGAVARGESQHGSVSERARHKINPAVSVEISRDETTETARRQERPRKRKIRRATRNGRSNRGMMGRGVDADRGKRNGCDRQQMSNIELHTLYPFIWWL